MPFKRYVLTLLKLTLLGGVGIVCASILYLLVLLTVSSEFRFRALVSVGQFQLAKAVGPNGGGPDPSNDVRDLLLVRQDHAAISNWVLGCVGITSPDLVPRSIYSEITLPTASLMGFDTFIDDDRIPPEIRSAQLSRRERAVIQLSKNLAENRLTLSSRVRASYLFWETTALISIGIGMITTILVSVSSTEFGRGDGRSQRFIRILAIVFPAVGTAAAAVIGFYSPQAEWGQASRTLASETQLHDQMALAVWEIICPKSDGDDTAKPLAAFLAEWSKRYTDIQAISNAASSPSGAQGSGNPPAGAPPASNQPGNNQPAASPSKPL